MSQKDESSRAEPSLEQSQSQASSQAEPGSAWLDPIESQCNRSNRLVRANRARLSPVLNPGKPSSKLLNVHTIYSTISTLFIKVLLLYQNVSVVFNF